MLPHVLTQAPHQFLKSSPMGGAQPPIMFSAPVGNPVVEAQQGFKN